MGAAERSNVYDLTATTARPTTAIQVVDYLIAQGLKWRASDLHLGMAIQPGTQGASCLLRLRVHGKLQLLRSDFVAPVYKEVVARMKVLANISTTDQTGPQDGQISINTTEGQVTVRLAIIPGAEGDEVTLRFQRSQKTPSLDQLGMTREMLQKVQALIQLRSGIIILNGPAGSGKTTTIYALLAALGSVDRKILTAEDPIELRLPFVSHNPITRNTSYAQLARAFMRQDGDVIFIGEVRDADSAEAAIQLAQTGHLVLTTLHTRDALGVIPRLEAFGIHPHFIASALIASLGQRLAPRLCPSCRVESRPDDRLIARMTEVLPPPAGVKYFKVGPGCPACSGGINGRVPFYELLMVDAQLAEMINSGAPRQETIIASQRKGMFTLAQEALMRVYTGYLDFDVARSYLVVE